MAAKKIRFFKSIGGKILLIFVILSILTILALAVITLNRTSSALAYVSSNQLSAIKAIKKTQIENFFAERYGDILVLAENPYTVEAVIALDNAFNGEGIKQSEYEGHTGGRYAAPASYKEVHDKYAPIFESYMDKYGYYDIFFLDVEDGTAFYTVTKEADFGVDVSTVKSSLHDVWAESSQYGKTALSDTKPYAPSNDAPAQFLTTPIKQNGKTIGILALQISLDVINGIMQEREGMGETGESYLVGSDKLMRSDSFLDPSGHSVIASMAGTVEKNGVDTEAVNAALSGVTDTRVIIDYNGNPVYSSWDTVILGDLTWVIIAEIDQAEVNIPINQIITFILILSGVILLVVVVVTILFSRSISKPMANLTNLATEIGIGNFDVIIDKKLLGAKDEIGALSKSFDNMIESLRYKGNMVEEVAKGNLTLDVKLASNNDALGKSLVRMNNSLNTTLGQVNMSVEQITIGADQVSQASQSLSQGATESAASLEEVSASVTQINSQSRQNAENATEANSLAKQSVEDADEGNKQMTALSGAMEKINTSSDEIKKIVKVIDDLAFQTNLLALNANVEAARAGKYGKGFAVVADEVRNLAVRSAAAVKETTGNVDDSIKNIEAGNKAVEATATQLKSIMEGSSKVADFLEEITTASKEQAEAIDQITKGLDQIDQVTQSNTASAEESAAAAEELASQSTQLKSMVATFKLKNGQGTMTAASVRQLEYQAPREAVQIGVQNTLQAAETGVKSLDPSTVINLDDEDFDRF